VLIKCFIYLTGSVGLANTYCVDVKNNNNLSDSINM